MARSLDDPLTIWYVWAYRLLLDRYVGRPTTVPAPEQPVRGFFAGVPDEIRVLDTALAGSDAAQDELAAVAHAWRQDGHQLLLTLWLAKLADVHLRQGEPEQALEHLDEADSFTERWGQGYLASDLARRRAVALRLLSDPACVAYASLAVERSVEMGASGLVLRARAELLRCSGDPAVAATLRAELDDLAATHHGADIDDACSALEEAAAGDGDV